MINPVSKEHVTIDHILAAEFIQKAYRRFLECRQAFEGSRCWDTTTTKKAKKKHYQLIYYSSNLRYSLFSNVEALDADVMVKLTELLGAFFRKHEEYTPKTAW